MNARQERFIEEYLIDLNATQAAIRAGYSPKTAQEQGARLLSKAMIRARVDEAKAERSRRTGITADRLLRELARVAFVNPSDVIDTSTATVRTEASEDDLAVIAGVKVKYVPVKRPDPDTGEITVVDAIEREVKLCDKLKALDLLAKHLGMYDKERLQDGGDGLEAGVVVMPPVMEPTAPPDLDAEGNKHE